MHVQKALKMKKIVNPRLETEASGCSQGMKE